MHWDTDFNPIPKFDSAQDGAGTAGEAVGSRYFQTLLVALRNDKCGIHPAGDILHTRNDLCGRLSTAALAVIAKDGNQPRCPSVEDGTATGAAAL